MTSAAGAPGPARALGPAEPPARYAVIGCAGRAARAHLAALARLPGASIVGLCDVDADEGALRAREIGSRFFEDHRDLLSAVAPDAVVICTPHPRHAELAKDCLRAGAHVLVEKPMASDVRDADDMIAAADEAGRVLAVNFLERMRPAVERARAFIAAGQLGTLQRVLSVEPWLRTAAYYRSAPWRGTWRGEGGGVLMNQAPHTLDVLCHLTGLPAKVWGVTRTRVHDMECEDSAHALFEYASGALGYLTVSTAEAGTEKRLEIVGDRAVLKLVGAELTVVHFDPSLRDHIAASPDRASALATRAEVIELPPREEGGTLAVHEDFRAAIRDGRQPRCDGRDGRMSLELANAIILSSASERATALPLDRRAYGELLAGLRG